MNHQTQKKTSSLADRLVEARHNSVSSFGDIAHRLELIDTINGVEYINDSKATDLGATEYSLEFIEKPIVWIVGESEFEEPYAELEKLVTYKIIGIIAFGNDTSRISRTLSDRSDYYLDVTNMEEAVKLAHSLAVSGQTVLLSPASPGYPFYKDFKARGEAFREAVANLHNPGGHYPSETF